LIADASRRSVGRRSQRVGSGDGRILARRHSQRVGRRRKPEIGAEAEPANTTVDESRRLGSRQGWKVDQETQVNKVSWKVELED
jgi:hypothetical protein